jgi:dTDP-4-dehydrorhamnose 3,5-epimerase
LADERGAFLEAFRSSWFAGVPPFVQGNISTSRAGTIRGMHFHDRQWDLWVPASGTLFAAVYDLRVGSPTEAAHETVELDAARPRALLIPPGVAHGYQALTDASLLYLVTNEYDGTDEQSLRFDDPALGFAWPEPVAAVSDRDRTAPGAVDVVRPSFGG